MGRFKNELLEKDYNPLVDFLLKNKFKKMDGARGEKGLTRIYPTDNELYDVWVTINLNEKVIYIYKEYNCGGQVGEDEILINKEYLENISIFVNFLDEALEFWIGK